MFINMDKYAIIMSGGSGKRLWPLSRIERPKQFLNLLGEGPLISSTIRRLDGVFERDHIFVIGTEGQREALIECTDGLIPFENIIFEPSGRNTGPCIALASHLLAAKGESVLCILPADHYIRDVDVFCSCLTQGIHAAESTDAIVTIGIKPTYDATGFGYIHFAEPVPHIDGAFRVLNFVEKPDKQNAKRFFDSGEYLWNGGYFIAKTSVMLDNIQRHIPVVDEKAKKTLAAMQTGDMALATEIYDSIEKIAIDFGVMEKCENMLVFPGDFGWSDVGSFYAVHQILQSSRGNAVIAGSLLAPQANNLTVYSTKKIVAASGVDNLVIIDMDDVLYICNVKDSEKTKQLVEELSAAGHSELE